MSVQDSINALTGRSADLKSQAANLLAQAEALDSAITLLQNGYQSDKQAIQDGITAALTPVQTAITAALPAVTAQPAQTAVAS